jgi:hypothetical protein
MVAILDNGLFPTATFRPDTENPRDPRCKLAFQRICGTCKHYQGDLRPARRGQGPAAGDTAKCGYFGDHKHRLAKAWKCPRWERKVAAHG